MNRHASVALRRFVDAAVGAHYEPVFARLDALVEGRCRCRGCTELLREQCADLVAGLPELPAVPAPRRPL